MTRLLSLSIILFCFLCNDSQNLTQDQGNRSLADLTQYIDFKMDRDNIPGLAACIVQDDRIVWLKGFGFQNIEQKMPMTTKSVLDVASISKIVTAIAVMQLAEHRQLDLNDPINKYLPFKIHHPDHPDAEITISQLLSHTSSMSNGPSLWRSYSCRSQTMNLGEWVKAYFLPEGKFYHKEGNFARWKPGEGFSYSNAEYPLLAYLIEIVSGKSFNEYCKHNIFQPLEMQNTSFELSDVSGENLTTMYSFEYNMDLERDMMQPDIDYRKIILGNYFFPLCNYTAPTIGSGGMYSSTEQLSHLLIALMHGGVFKSKAILSKESVAKILSPYVDPQLLPMQFASFGLGGYAMRLNNGEPVWGHTGANPGISTYMLFNPETKIGGIVLANRFVDIRDLIEWLFAEGFGTYFSGSIDQIGKTWKQYSRSEYRHQVVIRVVANYLPGNSRISIIGNHRYLGSWITSGIPMSPQKDRSWQKTFFFLDSAKIEFKITRGSWNNEAVTLDGKIPPKYSLLVVKDTVFNIAVEDWKDLVGG